MNTSGSTNSYYSGSLSSKPNWELVPDKIYSQQQFFEVWVDMIEAPICNILQITGTWY